MKHWLILTLTALVGFAALFTIDASYRRQIQQDNARQLAEALAETNQELDEGVRLRLLAVEDLRAFLLAAPTLPNSEDFEHYAALALTHYPEVRALQYVDPNHIIRYIQPLAGNEAALNLDLMTRPAAPFVQKAIQTRASRCCGRPEP